MLAKKNRVDKKGVDLLFKEGNTLFSPNLTFKFIKRGGKSAPQLSFVVPKSISKLAVKRNALRRLGYDALKPYLDGVPEGVVGVFLFKKYQGESSIIGNEIKNLLSKIN